MLSCPTVTRNRDGSNHCDFAQVFYLALFSRNPLCERTLTHTLSLSDKFGGHVLYALKHVPQTYYMFPNICLMGLSMYRENK